MIFGLETDGTRPSRVSSRLVSCCLDLVSSRDLRLVTGPTTSGKKASVAGGLRHWGISSLVFSTPRGHKTWGGAQYLYNGGGDFAQRRSKHRIAKGNYVTLGHMLYTSVKPIQAGETK